MLIEDAETFEYLGLIFFLFNGISTLMGYLMPTLTL